MPVTARSYRLQQSVPNIPVSFCYIRLIQPWQPNRLFQPDTVSSEQSVGVNRYDIIPVSGLKVQQAVTGLWRFCVCMPRVMSRAWPHERYVYNTRDTCTTRAARAYHVSANFLNIKMYKQWHLTFRVVSDTREWKHFKKLTQILTSKLRGLGPDAIFYIIP